VATHRLATKDLSAVSTVVVSRARLTSRIVLFVAVLAVSYWRLLSLAGEATWRRSPYVAFLVAPPAAAFLVLWRQQRAERELDVHDREIDFILVVAILALSVGLTVLLSRRLGTFATALAPEVLSVPLWTAAAAVALFGTRATIRHLYSLVVLGMVWRPPLFAAAGLVPAQAFGWFTATVILTVATGGALTRGSRLRRAQITRRRVLCVGAGLGMDVMLCQVGSAAPLAMLTGPLTVLMMAKLTRTPILGIPPQLRHLARGELTPGVSRARRAIVPVVAMALAAAFVPSVTSAALAPEVVAGGEGLLSGFACPDIGARWQSSGRGRIGDANRLGALPTTRCRYLDVGMPPVATVAVDVSDSIRVEELAGFPYEAVYRTIGTESPMQYTRRLPGPMMAAVLSFADPVVPLTTVVVTGSVVGPSVRSGFARRLDVIVTDDPRPGSPLPENSPHLLSAIAAKLSEVTRISPDQARKSTSFPKYGELAIQIAVTVVRQWGAR